MRPAIISADARSNHLLRALSESDRNLILPHLREITAERGQVLYEPGDDVNHAYFPCDQTLVSYLVLLEDGRGIETALIGREGAVGGIVSQGRLPAYCRSVVQFAGKLLKLESLQLEEAKSASPTVRYFFARYADCLLSQIFQSVACNAIHTIEQRTAKWLVAAMERTGDHVIPVEQEQLAGILGVGRSYVSRVINVLKQLGVLEPMRGRIRVHSLDMLKTHACGCNEMVSHHFETVLHGVYPHES